MHQTFIAPMTCPVCGTTSDDTSTGMQIGELPYPTDPPLYIHVGDRYRMTFARIQSSGCRVIRSGDLGRPYRLLQPWDCPTCHTISQWAFVEFTPEGDELVVRSITPMPKTLETLQQADAVSSLIVNEYALGESDWLSVLSQRIEEEQRS